jgi:hypothetical protein
MILSCGTRRGSMEEYRPSWTILVVQRAGFCAGEEARAAGVRAGEAIGNILGIAVPIRACWRDYGMQQLTEMGRLRDRFVGEWDIEVNLSMPDGSVMKGRGTAAVREAAGGEGIRSDLRFTLDGKPYTETDLWRYEPEEETIHMIGSGSDGTVHDHAGGWKDADTLELHWQGREGGQEAKETITVAWESPDTVRIRSETTVDGKPGPVMDSVGRRRKG